MEEMAISVEESTISSTTSFITSSSFTNLQVDEDFITDNTTTSNIFINIKNLANDFATEIKNDPNHWYLFLSIAITIVWAVYIVLYNSRIQGRILTAILRRFIKKGDINIGSFSISLLWGKFLFRDIVYITEDYSFRVVDAIVQFHYWLPYLKRELTEDMSKCDPRLWVELNGPELHVFNRSDVYSKLEEYFGLDSLLVPKNSKSESTADSTNDKDEITFTSDLSYWTSWRDLIPVIKIDFNMGRFVFGNRLVPSTLLLTMDKAENVYSTKKASSKNDHFMHVVTSHAENFKVILAPSPKYTGTLDEPPRFMGEGFVVLSSSKIRFYYYMDEPGIIPEAENILVHNEVSPFSPPVWGLEVKCEKGTNLSYGPWADRQREQLFKFFFPQDYQQMEIDKPHSPGEVRKVNQFDLKVTMLTEATIDILFSKEKETNAVHMTVQKGSYFEMTLPYVVKKNGYTIDIRGQMLYLDASTSLQYRSLLEAETLKYEISVQYPRIWNQHQIWDMDFYGVKVSYHFLYTHKEFFHDLIDDWSSSGHPDILHFVPYTWQFKFNFKHFEIITLANEYNWVDCSSQHLANSHVAFCGDSLQLMFTLPFVDFLPETVALKFTLLGKKIYMSLYLPPTNTTRNILSSLNSNAKLNSLKSTKIFSKENWRKFCKLSDNWIDCWYVPEVNLEIGYIYHPMPPLGPLPQANVSTPEKVELLLSPIRAPNRKKSPVDHKKFTPDDFDAMALPPDTFSVELKIWHPSEIKLYGSILRQFIHLKENIFGQDQKFIDMSQPNPYESKEEDIKMTLDSKEEEERKEPEFDERKYRPFEVIVNIDIRHVKGHLMKDCGDKEPPCPTIELDRLAFEMKKKYRETTMQVLLSPVILTTVDQTSRDPHHSHLHEGFLLLSGFQMRGHAMFSDEGLKPWEETLEYGWLVELTLGSLSGKLTAPQLQHIITGMETFVFTALDSENCLRHPRPYHLCYHGDPQPDCPYTLPDHFCPSLDIIKYKMIRTSVDAIDFHLVESGSDLNLQVYPIRIATCNLHGQNTRSGITAHIQNILLKNYVCGWGGLNDPQISNGTGGKAEGVSLGGLSGVGCSTSGSGGVCNMTGVPCNSYSNDVWIEAASLVLSPLYIDAAISSNILHHDMQLIQHKLLKLHDQKTKRLWFFWPKEISNGPSEVFGKCGCVGGCAFFGNNSNGQRFFKPSKMDFTNGLNIAQFRLNETRASPGYGQSILRPEQFIFNNQPYKPLFFCLYEGTTFGEETDLPLSSGYAKTCSPNIYDNKDPHCSRNCSFQHNTDYLLETAKNTRAKQATLERQASQDCDFPHVGRGDSNKTKSKFPTGGWCQRIIGESHTLGRPIKDSAGLSVPSGQCPGSLSDLHLSADNVSASGHSCNKMHSSLSLQAELPLSSERQTRFSISSRGDISNCSGPSRDSPPDPYKSVHRTISVGSEALSEAFYSADEDQGTQVTCRRGTSISPTSSQVSLPTVPEIGAESENVSCPKLSPQSPTINSPFYSTKDSCEALDEKYEIPPRTRSNSSSSFSSRESSTSSSDSSNTETCDYLNRAHGHSQTSLLHSSNSDISDIDGPFPETLPRKNTHPKKFKDDFLSEVGSISSTSFMSAVSSQNDGDSVDLHMQLNKPIPESPLLMSSYINHMTQVS